MTAEDSQTVPGHLVTPDLWAEMARNQALDKQGTPEGAALLAEARRLDACHQEIQHWKTACTQLRYELDKALEALTGEPHIDGWPLTSGLPTPHDKRSS